MAQAGARPHWWRQNVAVAAGKLPHGGGAPPQSYNRLQVQMQLTHVQAPGGPAVQWTPPPPPQPRPTREFTTFKIRLKPAEAMKTYFRQCFGANRVTFNRCLMYIYNSKHFLHRAPGLHDSPAQRALFDPIVMVRRLATRWINQSTPELQKYRNRRTNLWEETIISRFTAAGVRQALQAWSDYHAGVAAGTHRAGRQPALRSHQGDASGGVTVQLQRRDVSLTRNVDDTFTVEVNPRTALSGIRRNAAHAHKVQLQRARFRRKQSAVAAVAAEAAAGRYTSMRNALRQIPKPPPAPPAPLTDQDARVPVPPRQSKRLCAIIDRLRAVGAPGAHGRVPLEADPSIRRDQAGRIFLLLAVPVLVPAAPTVAPAGVRRPYPLPPRSRTRSFRVGAYPQSGGGPFGSPATAVPPAVPATDYGASGDTTPGAGATVGGAATAALRPPPRSP